MDLMSIAQLLGNIGEFLGAIAVVVTLVYLAIQVRLGKEATEANTRQMEAIRKLNLVENYMRRSERVEAGYRDMALSNDLSHLGFKALKDPGSVEEFEWFRMREWMHAHMHRLDAQHYQYEHGLLEEEAYKNLRRALRRWAPTWKALGVVPPRQSFHDEIEDALQTEEPAMPYEGWSDSVVKRPHGESS